MSTHRRLFRFVSIFVIASMAFSGIELPSASAQAGDGVDRRVNAQTGKVSFLGPESGQVLPAADALGKAIHPQDPAMELAKRFGPEFGLTYPERELKEMKLDRQGNGRLTVRYQQTYEGIPVLGGELVVNTNEDGDLYSMNGEVSPSLSLSTQPTIDSETARQTALEAVAKWHQKSPEDFTVSAPALWVYDQSLLRASTRPAELVWRMEVKPSEPGMHIHELVLVNAQRGGISLHFNQVDRVLSEAEPADSNDANRTHPSRKDYMPALLGATFYVSTTGNDSNSCSTPAAPCATISEGISRATENDTVKVAIGTYMGPGSEGITIYESLTLSGGWNSDFTAQNGTSIVDGEEVRRGFAVYGGTVTIDHFTIQHGYVEGINDVGGGIINTSVLTVSDSVVSGNQSGSGGGGIYNDGTLVINNTVIRDNLTGFAICGHDGGGGIENYAGTVTLNDSTVTGNTVVCNSGGGIRNTGSNSGIPAILILNGSTVSDNHGDSAIHDTSFATLTLNNSTVSNNEMGGIFKDWGHIAIHNSTITANEYGVIVDLSALGTAQNSIIAGNRHFDCYGNIHSAGYNLLGSSYNCMGFSPTTGDLVGTATRPINPHLTALQDNGGPTLTHALMIGSPALDAGNPLAPGSDESACLAADQRGLARPVGTRCDIGAYEGSVPRTPSPYVSTYWGDDTQPLPGTLICNQDDPECTAARPDAISVHKHTIGAYYFYYDKHSRDSIDDHGMTIISSIRYCTSDDWLYDDVFWNGEQMVYCEGYGYTFADDIIMHELTHGVTQYESNLFNYYQSGAINESFSDLWGEYYDQTNGSGTDTAAVKWQIGEDIVVLGTLRSMSNPPAFNHPDKMSSVHYYEGEEVSGGLHTNNGVNNKAVYLMVDGGTFNGKTVSALGWDKTADIYYEVNANLLTSGADYSDLYYALQQACTNLIGQNGITSGDCAEVKNAVDAVEMNGQPAPDFNTDAPYCTTDDPVTTVFSDDLEAGTANWTFVNREHIRWQIDSPFGPFAQSGAHSLYADDYPDQITHATAQMAFLIVPANAFLRFAQAYGFESGYNTGDPTFYHFDGGVLEYSINNGSTWVDAGSLIDYNGYKGKIFTGSGNPLSGHSAFVGDSHGYISTRLNLSSLVGKNVSFRWRMGLDEAGYDWGWWVDNVKVYTCGSTQPGTFSKTSPSNGSTGVGLNTTLSWSSSSNASSYQYCYDIINDNQCNRNWSATSSTSVGISNLGTNTTYYWQVRAVNAAGTTYADSQSWGSFTTTSTLPAGLTGIEAFINTNKQGKYSLGTGQSLRESYSGVNNGPIKIVSDQNIVAAERVIYTVNNKNTSFSEMMGLPDSQLDTTYWLPWYNNKDLDTQLRFANTTDTPASVQVSIGGQPMTGSPFTLAAGASTRVSFTGVNNGPVQIVSDVPIVAAQRVIYKINGVDTSFSEMMGLPNSQLDNTYWLPWYNNVDLDTQLRFANVSGSPASVHVYIGRQEMQDSPFTLDPGASTRKSFAGINAGPVKIVSDQNLVAAERVIYEAAGGTPTSFSETMALPNGQLDTTYWLPWYNNKDLDTQLRFANTMNSTATVHVYIGGVEMQGSPFTLLPDGSTRKSFPNINNGLVQIVSDVPIVAAQRVIYKVNGVDTSFSEMMALPDSLLSTGYWLPWYNNVDLDTQLRFGVP